MKYLHCCGIKWPNQDAFDAHLKDPKYHAQPSVTVDNSVVVGIQLSEVEKIKARVEHAVGVLGADPNPEKPSMLRDLQTLLTEINRLQRNTTCIEPDDCVFEPVMRCKFCGRAERKY